MIYNPVARAQCPLAVCVQLSDTAVSGGANAAPSHVQTEPKGGGPQDRCLCECQGERAALSLTA